MNLHSRYRSALLALFFLMGWLNPLKAQYNLPLINQYYTNPYLWNPAEAGGYDFPVVYATYKDQWTQVPGHPTIGSFTADMPIFSSSGIGLNVYNDGAGFQNRTKAVLSFSQTIFIDAEHHYLSFGLSGGIINQHINLSMVSGQIGTTDPEAAGYNGNNPIYPDVDFGIAYRLYGLDADFVLPNLVKFTQTNSSLSNAFIGLPTFFGSVGYNFPIGEDFDLHPKVAMRQVQGISNQFDIMALLTYRGQVSLGAFYHTDKTFTVSLGFLVAKQLDINYAYTQNSSALESYFGNTHEISIGYHFSSGSESRSSKNLLIKCPHPAK